MEGSLMDTKIILSPSKEMDFSPGDRAPALDATAKKILCRLQNMTEAELADRLQLKKEQARIIYDAYQTRRFPRQKRRRIPTEASPFAKSIGRSFCRPLLGTRWRFSPPFTAPSLRIRPSIPIGWILQKVCAWERSH